MVVAYSMVAVDKHTSLLLCLAWIRTSVNLVGSRVLPVMGIQVGIEGFST